MRYGHLNGSDFFPSLWTGGLDRFFDEVAPATARRSLVPPADIEETDTHYVLKLDVPGFSKDAIQVEVDDGILKIAGERNALITDGNKPRLHLSERQSGRFERRFTFNDEVDFEKIEAQFADGVLQVSIPKKESAKPRKIEVKVQ